MKISCEKALLLFGISTSFRAVSSKSTIPALEGLLLHASDTLSITGYNLETGIKTNVSATIIEEGSIVLPARLFSEIVRKLPDNTITITVTDLSVFIQCGQSEFTLMGLSPEDFPNLPEVDLLNSFTMEEKNLHNCLAQTGFAISDNESRPIHTGSLFEVNKEQVTIVAVDGFRLALRRENVLTSQGEFSFVVPGSALSEVEKICRDGDTPVTITVGAKHILFQMDETMLVSRRLEGEFLAWKQAIPKENPIRLVADTKMLLQSIERVSLIINEKLKSPLRCQFSSNELSISTKNAIGSAYDSCPITGDGESLEIGFNHRYLMDALKAAPADEICLSLSTSVSPCVISPIEGEEENFLYMVLPVRLKAGE